MRILTHLAAAALLIGAVPVAAPAQAQWQEQTTLTFDGPVQVPGMTLQPGSYLFQLANTVGTRQVVQIWNEDRTKLFTMTTTVPISRTDAKGDVVVKFASTPQGEPPAIKSWFYPGELTGHQFVYPEEQARQIARTSKELVLSGDIDRTGDADTAGATEFVLIDEQGGRQPFETHRPPSVAAASADAGEGSGNVQLHGLEGDDLIQHHLDHIVRLADASLSGKASERGAAQAVGTSGENETAAAGGSARSKDEMVTIPRAHLEQIREHAQKARQEMND